MKLFMLLLVPILSVQAAVQIDNTLPTDSDTVSSESTPQETFEASDDNALQVQVKGFLDTYHAVRTEGRTDWMASRTRARGELKLEKGAASLFLSLNATYNGILKERTGQLRPARRAADCRMGRGGCTARYRLRVAVRLYRVSRTRLRRHSHARQRTACKIHKRFGHP